MARVLVVEDEPSIRELLRYTLERDGHTVTEARDGVSVLRTFADEPPELIVLDIVIPDPDGLEICRRGSRRCCAAPR